MESEEILKFKCTLRVKSALIRCLLAEFIGTFVLVTLVDGGAGGVITSRLSGLENYLWLSFGSGFAVSFGIWTAYGVSGGHVNPSVTIGLTMTGKFPWRRVPFYFLAQFCGAFCAGAVCFLVYYDGINEVDGGVRIAVDHPNATCGIFTTFPAEYVTLTTGFCEQIVNTGIMLFLIHVIGDMPNAGPPFNLAPLFYGLIVFSVILSYGTNAGAPLNPARDLSGRLICAIAGYGLKVWAPYGVQWWWIPTFGPLVGAAVGSLLYLFFIEIHHPPEVKWAKEDFGELRDVTAKNEGAKATSNTKTSEKKRGSSADEYGATKLTPMQSGS